MGKNKEPKHINQFFLNVNNLEKMEEKNLKDLELDVNNLDVKGNKKIKLLQKQNTENTENTVKIYLKDISKYKLLTVKEEIEYSKRIQKGDKEALDQLVRSNLRLVIKIAKIFFSKEYSFIDLIQDGNVGLIRAAQKYDYKKKVRFSTYAAPWIKQMIIRALSQKKRIVRLPYRKEIILKKLKYVLNHLTKIYGKSPNNDLICKEIGISKKELIQIKKLDINSYSLDAKFGKDSNLSLTNTLGTNVGNPYIILEKKDFLKETKNILNNLLPKEREIILFRFGIGDRERHTLKEMGEKFNISAETVRQIESKILNKIKNQYKHLKNYI